MIFPFKFWFHRKQVAQLAQPIIQPVRILPLPCPQHSCLLIPEQGENGTFHFYCPLCRMLNQPVEKPVRQVRFPHPGRTVPGAVMSTERAVKRVEDKLHRQILPARPAHRVFHTNSKPIFASAPTRVELSAVLKKRNLPDAG